MSVLVTSGPLYMYIQISSVCILYVSACIHIGMIMCVCIYNIYKNIYIYIYRFIWYH